MRRNTGQGGGKYALLKTVPDGFLVGLQQYNPDTNRLALVKLNWQGSELWTKTIPTGRNYNSPSDLYIKSANEYVLMVAGSNTGQLPIDGAGFKYIAIGIDSTGNTRWRKTYLDPLTTNDFPKNILEYRNNGFMFTGGSGYNGFHPRVIKTDGEGNVLQDEFINTPESSAYFPYNGNFIQASDGKIVFTGFNFVDISNQPDRFLLVSKLDTSLNVIWTITHNEPGGAMESSAVIEMADSSILVVAQHHLNNKIILLKISSQGQVLDTTYIPVTSQTTGTSLMSAFLLPDSSLFYGGFSFIAKIAGVGLPMPPRYYPPVDTTDTLVNVAQPFIATEQGLGIAYPNPAATSVTIPYYLPTGTTSSSLQIAEVATGRLINRITLDLEAEKTELELSKFSSGIYTYTLLVNGVPAGTKKLVVIR